MFAHALFEHLGSPSRVLREMARVLGAEGVIALCSSDWSGARMEPETADVQCAMEGHYLLRRRAGGDPFAGSKLPAWVEEAGFEIIASGAENRVDMGYSELATFVATRLQKALAGPDLGGASLLREAFAAATRWELGRAPGTFTQRWVYVVARRPEVFPGG